MNVPDQTDQQKWEEILREMVHGDAEALAVVLHGMRSRIQGKDRFEGIDTLLHAMELQVHCIIKATES